ncbi:reticulon-2a isoform X2 [Paramormyrops kingsleyae]|uniref:reticulon-2a isoform X2 n=1 Tax=Paramormyrops kingsleyae TaxID=1676925 RepID=UPI000CD61BDD|nr:reticulon-1-A-like isoform X2 [Paramormyrops kingsleyae]
MLTAWQLLKGGMQTVLCAGESSPVAMETIDTLLVAEQPGGGITDVTSSTSSSSIGQSTQEEPGSEHLYSELSLSEDITQWMQTEVLDLIYWKDMERTGLLFTGLVVGLLSLFQLSIITVVSTLCLVTMCFTISVRIYYHVLHALQWGDGVHPFQWYLDYDISLTGEKADHYMRRTIVLSFSTFAEMKSLLLVANLVNSLKFLVLAYLLTYVGAIVNGLTIMIIGVIAVFSIPLFYRQRKAQIDNFLAAVKGHIYNVKDIFHRLCQGGSPGLDHDPTPGGAKPKIK